MRVIPVAWVVATALLPVGCGPRGDGECLAEVDPVVADVVEVIDAHRACTGDAECALVEPDLPCADLCAVAVNDPAAVEAALADAAPACPDCEVPAVCFEVQAYCALTPGPAGGAVVGTCDTCRDPGRVGDLRTPGDDCWAPPLARCSDVDVSREPVRACPPEGTEGACCLFDRDCLPCGWTDCSENPLAGGCPGGATGNAEACPAVPTGTICFDPERIG